MCYDLNGKKSENTLYCDAICKMKIVDEMEYGFSFHSQTRNEKAFSFSVFCQFSSRSHMKTLRKEIKQK